MQNFNSFSELAAANGTPVYQPFTVNTANARADVITNNVMDTDAAKFERIKELKTSLEPRVAKVDKELAAVTDEIRAIYGQCEELALKYRWEEAPEDQAFLTEIREIMREISNSENANHIWKMGTYLK